MLSFRIADAGAIEIDCDAQGMAMLMGALAKLVGERTSHLHLRGPSMGGEQLSEKTPHGLPAVGEVVINYAQGD